MGATLGQIIRERRMDLGLTQEELAERMGHTVRQSDVSRLERNKIGLPHRSRLEQIAAALEFSLGELLVASGWAGAIGLADKGPSSPMAVAPDTDAPSPVRTPPAHLSEAIERAEILILRSELAIAMSQDTAARVNDALQRRSCHATPDRVAVPG